MRQIVYSFLCASSICLGDALAELLSDEKNKLFSYDLKMNALQGKRLEQSWINPVMIRYGRNYTTQFDSGRVGTNSFSISIDQPIFRSGGIYFGIRYAQAKRYANEVEIQQAKHQMVIQAATLLFQIRKIELELKKLSLLIQNDQTDISQKRELYTSGLLDSGFLDQALYKKNQDTLRLHELRMALEDLKEQFALLSDKDPQTIQLPQLRLIEKNRFKEQSFALQKQQWRIEEKRYFAKMAWSKYLPAISVNARYINEDLNPLFGRFGGLKQNYYTYGIALTLPLEWTMFDDIEAAKLDALKAQTRLIEEEKALDAFYHKVRQRIVLIEKKIELSQKDQILYRRLLTQTKRLVKAGEKNKDEVGVMQRLVKIRQIDSKIYEIEKQIELLSLYAKVRHAL